MAPQALALFNGEFTRECARSFASRIRKEVGEEPSTEIERAFHLAFTRTPTESERAASLAFLDSQRTIRDGDADAALTDFCHTLLNASELIYPD